MPDGITERKGSGEKRNAYGKLLTKAIFYDLKTLDNMTLLSRKYDFIWPNKSDWDRIYTHCSKKHYQQK